MYQQIISEVETRDEENNEEHIATAQALVTVYYRPRELSSRCSINEKKKGKIKNLRKKSTVPTVQHAKLWNHTKY